MTSSNINKIVRSNINLKPWILSKNTSEIVNTCIQKIYKQSQTNFKNDIMQPKPVTPRAENKGPIRSLKSQERIRPPISFISRPKRDFRAGAHTGGGGAVVAGGGTRFASAAMQGKKSAVANLAANKRLLRSSPNYKIYSSRRFGSSASSSNASIFRRSEDRRRLSQTSQLNYLLRSFATTHKAPTTPNYGVNVGVARYALQARNQHMQSKAAVVLPVAPMNTSLQRDLMAIDHTIKERIALGRRGLKLAHRRNKDIDPLNGWNHPPPPELFMPRFKDNGTNVELEQQYQRLKIVNRMRQFEQLQQMEKRNTIMGNVGRKPGGRSRTLDAFGTVYEESPRATPHLSARLSVLDRARRLSMRKQGQGQAAEAENSPIRLAAPATPVTHTILSSAEAPSASSHGLANATSSTPNAAVAAAVASTEPAASAVGSTVVAGSSLVPALPAPSMVAASARGPSAPMPTATSMIAGTTTRTTAYNTGRFNRSSYSIRKF